jgi:hypothetical protein
MKKYLFLSMAVLLIAVCCGKVFAQQSLPVSGNYYLIKNQVTGNTYIGGNGTGTDAVKHENASTNTLYHYFLVTGDNTNGWTLQQVYTGLYITHWVADEWNGSYASATGTYKQLFQFNNSTNNNYIKIQKKKEDGSFANGIGFDNTASGSTLYFDKSEGASDKKYNQWLFEDAAAAVETAILVPRLQTTLSSLISQANSIYDAGKTGASVFWDAITAAETAYATATTVSALETAIADLQAAIDVYGAANPTTGAFSGLTFKTSGYESQTFDGTSYPSGWSGTAIGVTPSVNGNIGVSGSGQGGSRAATINFTGTGSANIVYNEFDLIITSATIASKNAFFCILQDNGTEGANRIFNLYLSGNDGKFHLQNLDNTTEALIGTGTTAGNYKFNKQGSDDAACNANNASTITEVSYSAGTTYKIKSILDFTNHKIIKLMINGTEIASNVDFLSPSANNAGKILLCNTRGSSDGNGGNVTFDFAIDNFEIGELIPTTRLVSGDDNLQTIDAAEVVKTYTLSQYQSALGVNIDFPVTNDVVWTISEYGNVSAGIVSITEDSENQAQATLKTTDAVAADATITIAATVGSEIPVTKSVLLKAVNIAELKSILSAEIETASALDDAISDTNPYLTSIIGALTSAIQSAQEVYDDENATALQVNNAIIALQTAEGTFGTMLTAYDDFVRLISTAQTLHDNESGYETTDIKATLQTAIDAATEVCSTIEDAADLANAVSALQAAIDAFHAAPRDTVIANFDGNNLFDNFARDYDENSALTCTAISNPLVSCLNHSENALHINCSANEKWYYRALLRNSSNTPVAVTSENKYLHMLIYSSSVTDIVLKFRKTSSETWNDIGEDGQNTYTITPGVWQDVAIDLSAVKGGAISDLYGIFLAGHWGSDQNSEHGGSNGFSYFVDEIVLNNSATPRACSDFIVNSQKNSSDYLAGNYNDIIFEEDGQLTVDKTNHANGLKPFGVVKVNKTFAKDTWYAVGFPFDIASVNCAEYENGRALETFKPDGSGDDRGDYWLKTCSSDGASFNDYTSGSTTIETGGYALQVPDALHNATFTFTSESSAILSNSSSFSKAAGSYKLTCNPSVANLEANNEGSDYFYAFNTPVFEKITASYTLKPFESIVIANGIAESALRSIVDIEAPGTPTIIIPMDENDTVVSTEYYNLQGVRVFVGEAQTLPSRSGVYIVKQIYRSGKTSVSKSIIK